MRRGKRFVYFFLISFFLVLLIAIVSGKLITGYGASQYTNISIFILPSVGGANITSWQIVPYDPFIGKKVFLNASATDNASGIFANITLPNGSVIVLKMPVDYVVQLSGKHDIVFWANDSNGNIGKIAIDYFIAGTIGKNITFNVVDRNFSGILTNLTIYFANINKEVNFFNFSGVQESEHSSILYDLFYLPNLSSKLSIRMNSINLFNDDNKTLILDIFKGYGFLIVYGINSSYSIANASVGLSYKDSDYINEDNLKVYKCNNWDIKNRVCNSEWNLVDAVQDKSNDLFFVFTTGFSAFGIKEEFVIEEKKEISRGGAGAKTPEFSVDKKTIEVDLMQGERRSVGFEIINLDSRAINFNISLVGIDNFGKLSAERVRLLGGESKKIIIDFDVPVDAKPIVYFGEIVINSGYEQKKIILVVRIREVHSLFELDVNVLDKYKKVYAGENVVAEIVFENVGLNKSAEIGLSYSVRDINGRKLFESKKGVFITEQMYFMKRFFANFVLSDNIGEGIYLVVASIEYGGRVLEAYDSFVVIKKKFNWILIANLILLAVIFVLLFVAFLILRRRKQVLKIRECYSEKELRRLLRGLNDKQKKFDLMFEAGRIDNNKYLSVKNEILIKKREIEKKLKKIKLARKRYSAEEKRELGEKKRELKEKLLRLKQAYKEGVISRKDYERIRKETLKEIEYVECEFIKRHIRSFD
ncbi:MAG: hypothetical protein N3D20_02290 [Candidatus Pacearchaeota archaeon]|nr:hypothetical protein [Candidatus Pacearchaeota archaeon]